MSRRIWILLALPLLFASGGIPGGTLELLLVAAAGISVIRDIGQY